jgi:hypothetical protein
VGNLRRYPRTERQLRITTYAVYNIETGELLERESYEYSGPLALADRGANKQAKQAAGVAQGVAGQERTGANQIGSSLIPGLEQEANNPTGYTPAETNNMLVAGEQGAGGATSGITGEGAQMAAKTRNAGGYGAALDQAARDKTQALSNNALGVANKSANLAQEKQQSAQGKLAGLYGTDTSAMLSSMGLQTGDINAEINADKTGWVQDFTQIMQGLGALGQGAGAAAKGFGG